MAKILIVDDDPLMPLLYKPHLERAGYQLCTAQNGRQAIEVAALELPQLIIMDILMSEIDGLTAVRQLKKTEVTKDIHVIVISSSPHRIAQQEALQAGAAVFLMKPFSPAQLLAEVQRLVPQA